MIQSQTNINKPAYGRQKSENAHLVNKKANNSTRVILNKYQQPKSSNCPVPSQEMYQPPTNGKAPYLDTSPQQGQEAAQNLYSQQQQLLHQKPIYQQRKKFLSGQNFRNIKSLNTELKKKATGTSFERIQVYSQKFSRNKLSKLDTSLPPLLEGPGHNRANMNLYQDISYQCKQPGQEESLDNSGIGHPTTDQYNVGNSQSSSKIAHQAKRIIDSRSNLTNILKNSYYINNNERSLNQIRKKISVASVKNSPTHQYKETRTASLAQVYPASNLNSSFNYLEQLQNEMLDLNEIPQIEPSKCSSKSLGTVTAYAANTHQGLVRNYNEDRVSIILNMVKPPERSESQVWPNCSFFAIYDGHGGTMCAEFLRDNLHYFIIKEESFPADPILAMKNGFSKAEKQFLEKAESQQVVDKSGSCAIVAMIVDDMCYYANLGDSRVVLSQGCGKKKVDLTQDHKPSNKDEEIRITRNGGQIYQSSIPIILNGFTQQQQFIMGPMRVNPGRLAVSRTLGDIEAKLAKYGGKPNVISAEPETGSFKLENDMDFLVLACDGIFDKLTNQEVIDCAWQVLNCNMKNVHEFIGKSIENIMKQALVRKSFDNVTVVIVGLHNLEPAFKEHLLQQRQVNSSRIINSLNQNKENQVHLSGPEESKDQRTGDIQTSFAAQANQNQPQQQKQGQQPQQPQVPLNKTNSSKKNSYLLRKITHNNQ